MNETFIDESFKLFDNMRELTKEEQKIKQQTLKKVSKPTGKKFLDFYNETKEKNESIIAFSWRARMR